MSDADVLVVGGGMAGAIAALAARREGARVVLVRRAPGATALSSGAVSVAPDGAALPGDPFSSHRGPLESARRVAAASGDHPYAAVGVERLGEALAFAQAELVSVLAPGFDRPRFLATQTGGVVSCALCQRSMEAGDLGSVKGLVAVVGFREHAAFDAQLVAGGLAGHRANGAPDVGAVEVAARAVEPWARPHEIARALEADGAAEALGQALRAVLPVGTAAALLPPVLGIDLAARVPERVEAAAGVRVAETLSDVPSVPGLRLARAIDARLAAAGVEVVAGAIAGARGPGEPVTVAGRTLLAPSWVIATGCFVGGGIARRGRLVEPALGLDVQAAEGRESGVHLAVRPPASLTVRDRRAPQPLLSAGLRVDRAGRPLDERGRPAHRRLFAAGGVLGGHEHATDGTGLGVAILTGFLAGLSAAAEARR